MTILQQFLQADKKVTEIENNGGLFIDRYSVESTEEYDLALETSQKLYKELQENGVNPFK